MAREREWLTAAETCREYGIARRTLDSHRKKGIIEYKLRGGIPVYHRKEIERYLSPQRRVIN